MTRRDYERAVLVIKDAKLSLLSFGEKALIIETFVDFFAGDNVRFNKKRFVDACLKEVGEV